MPVEEGAREAAVAPQDMDGEGQGEGEAGGNPPAKPYKNLALAISLVMHPLLVPSILFTLVFLLSPQVTAPLQESLRLPMLGLLVLTTFLIPLSCLLILYYIGSIPSLQMPDRKQRSMPFLFVSVFYAVTSYLFISKYPQLVHLNIILAGITFIIFLITAVTQYWKISAHSAAVSGAVGFLAAFVVLYRDPLLLYALAGMVVFAGAVMSARLYLNEHEPTEVWIGGLLGLFVSIASVFFFLLM
jgi:membrane-associated phospholipid phosphatase